MEKRLFKPSTSIKKVEKIYIFPESGSRKHFQLRECAQSIFRMILPLIGLFWKKIFDFRTLYHLRSLIRSSTDYFWHRLEWNERFETIRMKRHNGTKPNSGFSCQYSGKFKPVSDDRFNNYYSYRFIWFHFQTASGNRLKRVWICLNIDTKTLNLVSFHYVVSFVSFYSIVSFVSFHPLRSIRAYALFLECFHLNFTLAEVIRIKNNATAIRDIFIARNITFKPEDALIISKAIFTFNLRTIHFSPVSTDQKPECYRINVSFY